MADSNRTGQRLLDSIRKAKAGDEPAAEAPASAADASAAPSEPELPQASAPTRKTTAKQAAARRTTAKKAPARKAPAKKVQARRGTGAQRGATTAAPYPMFATERPQPAAYPGAPTEDDPYRSAGRVWPD
ncbi:hypothetical protein [uncultured Thiohalocapsa sp.]|uniref:hypothetical protein n=1 Tax=uncultured Thiohalocapsa sp. TaxID=768990 RepID=UPI0025EF3DDC|nr:hypothetical protein [uncultured Thiohalocapsa sp.]